MMAPWLSALMFLSSETLFLKIWKAQKRSYITLTALGFLPPQADAFLNLKPLRTESINAETTHVKRIGTCIVSLQEWNFQDQMQQFIFYHFFQ